MGIDLPGWLAERLERTYGEGNWAGKGIRPALEGLTAAEAHWRPVPAQHTIAEIAWHMAYWCWKVAHWLDPDAVPAPGGGGGPPRQQLLDAAEAAFGRRGYFETSITDITRRAGVAQGTFYVYFPSKRAIFTELVRERSRDLRRTIQEAGAGLTDRREIERAGGVAV